MNDILQAEVERLEAEAAAMREALEHSTTALEYVADELRELGEDGDGDMMERQAKENHRALAADAGRALLERLRRAEQERDESLAVLEAVSEIEQTILGNVAEEKAA